MKLTSRRYAVRLPEVAIAPAPSIDSAWRDVGGRVAVGPAIVATGVDELYRLVRFERLLIGP